jgi:hypothetical protein
MEKLKQIINDLGKLRSELGIEVTDELIFEQGVKIFISNNIQNEKRKNSEPVYIPISDEFSKLQKQMYHKEEPATDKQKFAVKKIKGVIPAGLTKNDAYLIIKESKEKRR